MDKASYIAELLNFTEQFLDNSERISENVIQYNCIICGRSKHNEPHMRIDYNNGFYFCYRCQEGGILYNLVKEFKNNNNKEYVNTLLKLYFTYFAYNPTDKKVQSAKNYSSYEFTSHNATLQEISDTIFSDVQLGFLKLRFPTLNDNKLIDIVKKFRINIHESGNKIFYNSFHRKFSYAYILNEDFSHRKEKYKNGKITNDKKDYYHLLNNYNADNLYISEGLFDLITLFIIDKLGNIGNSNFLALCSRNYNYLYGFLLNTGKFFYKNIYLVLDNDINKSKFIDGFLVALSNNKNTEKYRLYENLYVVNPPKEFIDINNYYLTDNEISNLLIKKIR